MGKRQKRTMKLSNIFVFAATFVDARPPEKQLQHLKKASQQIFQHYIVSPIPDASSPAHQTGWLTSEKRRNNRAGKMENQYGRLNDIIDSALELGCYPTAEQRVAVDPRFVKNNFKKAMIQLTRNYLKMEGTMDSSKTSKKNDDVKLTDSTLVLASSTAKLSPMRTGAPRTPTTPCPTASRTIQMGQRTTKIAA